MACDLEEEEGVDGEMTGDEIFDSEPGTSVTTTPACSPMPPIDTLVEQTTVIMEPNPKVADGGVITEQVTGLQEHQRPGSELAGVSIVTEQPVRSEPLPIRCVLFEPMFIALFVNSHHGTVLYRNSEFFFLNYLFSENRVDSISELPPPPPEIMVMAEEPVVEATTGVAEQVYCSEGDAASVASVDR